MKAQAKEKNEKNDIEDKENAKNDNKKGWIGDKLHDYSCWYLVFSCQYNVY